MVTHCLAELEDDGGGIVNNVRDETHGGFQSHEYDESMVLGLMGVIDMTLLEDEIE
jgi:hypothetical protein